MQQKNETIVPKNKATPKPSIDWELGQNEIEWKIARQQLITNDFLAENGTRLYGSHSNDYDKKTVHGLMHDFMVIDGTILVLSNKELGSGSSGCVFYAEDEDGHEYAVKQQIILPGFLGIEEAEGKIAEDLNLALKEVIRREKTKGGSDVNHSYIAYHYYGQSSDAYLHENPLTAEQCYQLCIELALKLSDLHTGSASKTGEPVLHRDFHENNITIDHKGMPHIIDFGLSIRWADNTNTLEIFSELFSLARNCRGIMAHYFENTSQSSNVQLLLDKFMDNINHAPSALEMAKILTMIRCDLMPHELPKSINIAQIQAVNALYSNRLSIKADYFNPDAVRVVNLLHSNRIQITTEHLTQGGLQYVNSLQQMTRKSIDQVNPLFTRMNLLAWDKKTPFLDLLHQQVRAAQWQDSGLTITSLFKDPSVPVTVSPYHQDVLAQPQPAQSERKIKIIVHDSTVEHRMTDGYPYVHNQVTIEVCSGNQMGTQAISLGNINHNTKKIFGLINDSYKVEICFEDDTKPSVILSKTMADNLVRFLKQYKPETVTNYCCHDFARDMKYGPQNNIDNEDRENKGQYIYNNYAGIPYSESIKPDACEVGDIVGLFDCDGLVHSVVHVGHGFYLSLFGTKGPLKIATLNELKNAYVAPGAAVLLSSMNYNPVLLITPDLINKNPGLRGESLSLPEGLNLVEPLMKSKSSERFNHLTAASSLNTATAFKVPSVPVSLSSYAYDLLSLPLVPSNVQLKSALLNQLSSLSFIGSAVANDTPLPDRIPNKEETAVLHASTPTQARMTLVPKKRQSQEGSQTPMIHNPYVLKETTQIMREPSALSSQSMFASTRTTLGASSSLPTSNAYLGRSTPASAVNHNVNITPTRYNDSGHAPVLTSRPTAVSTPILSGNPYVQSGGVSQSYNRTVLTPQSIREASAMCSQPKNYVSPSHNLYSSYASQTMTPTSYGRGLSQPIYDGGSLGRAAHAIHNPSLFTARNPSSISQPYLGANYLGSKR